MAFSSEIEKLERRWQENPLGLTFAPLAEAYRKAGEYARALELLDQGLTQHPNYVPGHIVRGRCHLDSQSDPDAELAFQRVTELDPENVIALKSLAELSERAGRIPEAVHRLELLLDVDRNNEEARGQLDRVKDLLGHQSVAAPPEPVPVAVVEEPEPNPAGSAPDESAWHAAPQGDASPTPAEPIPTIDDTFDDGSLGDLELEAATQLHSAPSHEFQIANDSETLEPSAQGIPDIVLGAEPPEDFPIDESAYGAPQAASAAPPGPTGAESVNALLGGDYASLMAYRDVPEPPPVEAAVVDVLPPPPPSPVEEEGFMPPAPSPADEALPMLETNPEPEPAPEPAVAEIPETEPEPEAVAAAFESEPHGMVEDYVPVGDLGAPTLYQPAAPQSEEPEAPAAAEPELVVTETMAEIFLRQGHRELALAVYAQLALREPENERIAEALARLTPEPPAPEPPSPEPVRRVAATETGGRSVGELFGALLAATRPNVPPTIHPPAFEQPKKVSGEPTRAAQESLSLSSVFGEEAPSSNPAESAGESRAGEPSFDEFFAPATGAADIELPRTPDGAAGGSPAQVPEDLEQFNAWLRGLKR